MKFYQSALFLMLAKVGNAVYCGCDSCTQDVWGSYATDADGTYTCGGRIDWLQSAQGYDERSACIQVGSEFPNGPCGPACDPTRCNPPTPEPTPSPTPAPTQPPTPDPTQPPAPKATGYCGCDSCTQDVWESLATDGSGSFTCGGRIDWLRAALGYDEARACIKVSSEFPDGPCGPACDPGKCNASEPTMPPVSNPHPLEQRCGGAVDYTNDPGQACQKYLWGPTGDNAMPCFAYGGSADPCHLNNNNDENDGLFKDPSMCYGDTFYLWDEPDTQGRDYTWAGREWLAYSERFSQELEAMRSRGTVVTGPLLKAGDSGVLEQNMRTFFDACGAACLDPFDSAFIDVIAVNGFCGPWNGPAGCRGGAAFIYSEAERASNAFNNLPVYVTNWSRLQTSLPSDQIDAIESIDEFFPSPKGVVERVYWFGARDYGGGAETTGYLTNTLPDGRTLGDMWRVKCDSLV